MYRNWVYFAHKPNTKINCCPRLSWYKAGLRVIILVPNFFLSSQGCVENCKYFLSIFFYLNKLTLWLWSQIQCLCQSFLSKWGLRVFLSPLSCIANVSVCIWVYNWKIATQKLKISKQQHFEWKVNVKQLKTKIITSCEWKVNVKPLKTKIITSWT